jgi:hypothetical protein
MAHLSKSKQNLRFVTSKQNHMKQAVCFEIMTLVLKALQSWSNIFWPLGFFLKKISHFVAKELHLGLPPLKTII